MEQPTSRSAPEKPLRHVPAINKTWSGDDDIEDFWMGLFSRTKAYFPRVARCRFFGVRNINETYIRELYKTFCMSCNLQLAAPRFSLHLIPVIWDWSTPFPGFLESRCGAAKFWPCTKIRTPGPPFQHPCGPPTSVPPSRFLGCFCSPVCMLTFATRSGHRRIGRWWSELAERESTFGYRYEEGGQTCISVPP